MFGGGDGGGEVGSRGDVGKVGMWAGGAAVGRWGVGGRGEVGGGGGGWAELEPVGWSGLSCLHSCVARAVITLLGPCREARAARWAGRREPAWTSVSLLLSQHGGRR